MKKITTVAAIRNPYSKRILGNILHRDPLSICKKTPAGLKRLTNGLTRKELQTPSGKGKWPMSYILANLCDAELVMGYRMRKVIAESGGTIQAYDQDKWAGSLRYDEADCLAKVELFGVLRKSHLTLLKSLSRREWQRFGIHSERGKETVERMVQMLAGHDVNHLTQLKHIRETLLRKRK